MRTGKSRLVLAGALAIALSVIVALPAGAAGKKKKGKNTVTVTATNKAIPDRAPGVTSPLGRLDVPLNVGGKFKGRTVGAAGSVEVTLQTTGSAAGAPYDLTFEIINPKGRTAGLSFPFAGPASATSVGPLVNTPDTSVVLCAAITPPCTNPDQSLLSPWSGRVRNASLALFAGTPVKGTWILRVFDNVATKTSTLNKVQLKIGLD